MTRSVRSKRLAALIILMIPVSFAATRAWKLISSATAEADIRDFCSDKGGYLGHDNVDGDLWIHLENAHLDESEMAFLRRTYNRCFSDWLGRPAVVHLYLSHCTFDGDFLELIDEQVIGLTLTGLRVDDAMIERIVERGANIGILDLNNTDVSDESIRSMRKLAIKELNVANTNITYTGLYELGGFRHLYLLRISPSVLSEHELSELSKHLSCVIVFDHTDGSSGYEE